MFWSVLCLPMVIVHRATPSTEIGLPATSLRLPAVFNLFLFRPRSFSREGPATHTIAPVSATAMVFMWFVLPEPILTVTRGCMGWLVVDATTAPLMGHLLLLYLLSLILDLHTFSKCPMILQ